MQIVYQLAPLIADIIAAHCPGTRAGEEFLQACVHGDWFEAKEMVEGVAVTQHRGPPSRLGPSVFGRGVPVSE